LIRRCCFDPLEEKLHLPAQSVQVRNGQRRQIEIVSQENKMPGCFRIVISDPAQGNRIILGRIKAGQENRLVEPNSGFLVDRKGIPSLKPKAFLGADDEKSLVLVERIKPGEIQIAAIHDVKRARLGGNKIEDFHIGQFSVGNVDEFGDAAAQIGQRMQLDRAFGFSEFRPREE